MKIQVRKGAFGDRWLWDCPVCHYGMNIPWEETSNWADAMAEAEFHLALHRVAGKRLEWTVVL